MDQWMLVVTLAQLQKVWLYIWRLLALVQLAAVFHCLLFLTMCSSLGCLSFVTMIHRPFSLLHLYHLALLDRMYIAQTNI